MELNTDMQNKYKNSNYWLKANGINPKMLMAERLDLLQAQKIAHNLLKHHAKLLGQNEAASLNNFLLAMNNGKKRKKLTKNACYKVMNIGTAVNRKLFTTHRKTKA